MFLMSAKENKLTSCIQMREVINMLSNINILTSHPSWVLKVNYERAGFLALVHHSPTSSQIKSSDLCKATPYYSGGTASDLN